MNDLNELRNESYDDAVKHGLWDEVYLWKTVSINDVLRDSGALQIYKIANTERETMRVNAALRAFLENQELWNLYSKKITSSKNWRTLLSRRCLPPGIWASTLTRRCRRRWRSTEDVNGGMENEGACSL